MPLFRCSIRGDNFPGKLIGKAEPVGFFTTRYIDAASAEEAESLVVELLREDSDLDVPAKYRTQEAKVFFERIVEVAPGTERKPNKGFTFFVMGT